MLHPIMSRRRPRASRANRRVWGGENRTLFQASSIRRDRCRRYRKNPAHGRQGSREGTPEPFFRAKETRDLLLDQGIRPISGKLAGHPEKPSRQGTLQAPNLPGVQNPPKEAARRTSILGIHEKARGGDRQGQGDSVAISDISREVLTGT